jgi:serine protease Do
MAALATVVAVGVSDRWMSRRALATGDPKTRQVRPPLTELQSGLQELTAVSRAFKSVARAAQPGVVHIRVTGGLRSSMSREDVKSYVRERLDDWLKAEGLDSRPAERTGGPRDAQRDREIREYLSDFVDAEQLAELDPRLLEKLYEKRAYLEKVADRAPSPPGSGSGLIFDAAGYVLTNNHVIEERSNITVVLHDERECPATLIGTDPKTDLAVLKIAATDLHPLPFGDSDTLEIGDWVLAVGSPFGLVQTVTHGIVSAKGRTHVPGIDIDYQDFIQTDASINPGNSGGPLLNLSGEVVGVNTAIATHGDGQSTGIAFTIPANRAARIADQLKLHGVVARGWLGVSFVELEPADRELLGLATARSVAVERVLCGSPAEQAGLMVEDVVVDLNGKPVAGSEQLRGMIADMGPQASVHVRVLRDGAERRIDLRLGSQPADLDAARHSRAVEARLVRPLGVWARTFRPGLVHQYNLPYDPSARGVLIWQLDQDWSGPREVKESELITACNGVPVRNVRDLCVALDGIAAGTRVKLEIRPPSGDPRLVTVKLPAGRQARTP